MVRLGYCWELQNGVDLSVCFGFGGVYPSQRRSLVALMRKWKGSRGTCVSSPLGKNSREPHSSHTSLPPPEEVISHLVFIQLQVEGPWDLFDTVLTLLLRCVRNEAPGAEAFSGTLEHTQCRGSGGSAEFSPQGVGAVKYLLPISPEIASQEPGQTDSSDRGCGEGLKGEGGQMGLN